MPGSLTTPGCPSTRAGVLDHIAFRYLSALWLACAIPFHRWPRGQRADRTGTAVLGDDDLPGRGRKQISS